MNKKNTVQDRFLTTCYSHVFGRILLKPLVCKPFSEMMGKILDSRLSKIIIPAYQRILKIDMSDVATQKYHSFNDFFTRKLKDGARQICNEVEYFPSPCDGRVTVIPIKEDSLLYIKHTKYSLKDIFRSQTLAQKYKGGTAIILRLTVSDYHRYIYSVSGKKSSNRRIQGIYHTVNPVANDYVPIYKTNTREYTKIESPIYGPVIQMEVGALCVGRIVNYEERTDVVSGMEKGRFEFGGSTIVLFFQKGQLKVCEKLLANSEQGIETYVRMGESLGKPGGHEKTYQ